MIEYDLEEGFCQFNFKCDNTNLNDVPFAYGLKFDIPDYDRIDILHNSSMVTGFKFFLNREMVVSIGVPVFEELDIMTKTLDFEPDQMVLGIFATRAIEGKSCWSNLQFIVGSAPSLNRI